MDNKIKGIRIIVFSIIFLMFMELVIVECVDNMSVRNILIKIGYVVCVLLVLILKGMPQLANKRVTIVDFLNIAMFIGVMAYLGKGLSSSNEILTAFQGNNVYACYFSEGSGDNGYDDIESLLKDEIEYGNKTGNYNELEEICRIQVGEKLFVYFKKNEEEIIEYDFFRQDDLYYCSGDNILVYDGVVSSDSYTAEETIRKDIANTMFRGVGRKEVGAPAWGVSTDERISSMTVNAEPVDDVILIKEKAGKKYYFWITTNVEGIETIDDVKAAEIEMNGL